MRRISFRVLLLFLALAAFGAQGEQAARAPDSPRPRASRANKAWVEKTLRGMSVDEKIGQLLIPNIGGGFRNVEGEEFQRIARDVTQFHIGGIHVAAGEPPSTMLLIRDLQRLAKVPLFVTADLEGGAGYIFPGATRFPLAMAIGATGNTQLAYEAGRASAVEGRAVGVNVDFYPVVDVNNNPRNPIINIRSFGEDPHRVSSFARAYIRGVQDAGVLATAKHFPGHGDVASDSHLEMPVLEVDRQRLNSLELVPFRAAIEEGVGAIMSAHIYLPALESQRGIPATLSGSVLRDLLRKEMGFAGIVFTDAMTMRAISSNFKEDEAAIRAVEAGADIILYPPNVERVFNALKGAVSSGRLSVARLDESVRRLLDAKSALGLPGRPPADLASITRLVGSQAHRDLAQRINESAITVVRDERKVLPLRMGPDQRLLHINLLDTRSGWREGAVGRVLTAEVPKRAPKTTTVQLDDVSTRNEYELTRKLVDGADAVLLTAFIRVAPYKGSIDLNREQLSFLRDLSAMKKPFVFVLFGSPYLLHHLPELPSYLLTYDFNPGAERAVVRAVFGEIPVKGRLPVSLPGLYPIGHGLER